MDLSHLEYDTSKSGWGHLPATEEVFSMFREVSTICNPKQVLEVGFFVGHSTTYMLELFPRCRIITHGLSSQFKQQKSKIEAKYPGRVYVDYSESWNLYGKYAGFRKFDFAFIDGSHKPYMAANDALHAIMLGAEWLLVDNCEQRQVTDDLDKFLPCVDLYKEFSYNATHKGKTTRNKVNLYHVRTDDIQKLIR